MSKLTFPSIEFTSELSVRSNSTWTIGLQDLGSGVNIVKINDVLIGSGTYQGSGDERVRITFLANSTGSNRSVQLNLISTTTSIITLTQAKSISLTRIVAVVNNNEDNGNTATQAYDFTSNTGSDIQFTNTVFDDNNTCLYNLYSNYEGFESVPSDGDTIQMKAYEAGTSTQQPFSSSLGNRMLYLVSNTLYGSEDITTMLSLATNVTPTLSAGVYTSSFTYTRGSNKYLYLLYDYRNNITAAGSTVSMASGVTNGTTTNMKIDFTVNAGNVRLDYDANSTANTFILKQNNIEIFNSGSVTGAGMITFLKTSNTSNVYDLQVLSTGVDDGWSIVPNLPTLTSFSIDNTGTTLANVCANTASNTKYHNGSAALPIVGDVVYENPTGTSLFDGGDNFHKVSTNDYALVNSSGIVTIFGNCTTCSETAIPVINTTSLTITQGDNINLQLDVTNNPEDFNIISSCNSYSLLGGTKGAVFTITDCDSGSSLNVTVASERSSTICSSSSPVLVSGTGTFASLGVCGIEALPNGISLDSSTGALSGSINLTGIYTFNITATNCFGTSANTAITLTVNPDTILRRYNMDISNPSNTSTLACAVTPSYAQMYHNGAKDYPEVNDFIYTFVETKQVIYNGGYKYYITDELTGGKNNILRIDSVGQVVEKVVCP